MVHSKAKRLVCVALSLCCHSLCSVDGALTTEPRSSVVPYRRDGVMAWNVGPPTPFYWPPTREMMVYESARYCHGNGTYWPPDPSTGELQPYSNQSYFRIRRMSTGEVVGNVQGSEGYAYGSAVVDPLTGTAWVFGSPRDLCHRGNSNDGRVPAHGESRDISSSETADEKAALRTRVHGPPLGPNYVRAWWSDDLVQWHTAVKPALGGDILDAYPFNTRVASVTSSPEALAKAGLPESLNFVMVLEHGRVALHFGPSRNLSTGWVAANNQTKVQPSTGFGPCPSIHHAAETGHFYVISGGNVISLSRTLDFRQWEHASEPLVTVDKLQWQDATVSPYLGIADQIRGRGPDKEAAQTLRRVLAHPECWEFDVNDADFCCQRDSGAPNNTAYLLYSPSSQGNPPRANCSSFHLESTDFNGVATANVSLTELLQSHFS